jgi:general stress protein 26
MAQLKLKDISDIMAKIDICMMTTMGDGGDLDSRPMSNNQDVEYKGDAFFFANGDTPVVQEITAQPAVNLAYAAKDKTYIAVSGMGQIIRDKAVMKEHWVPDLEKWFADGVDTPGLALIQVTAKRIKYWQDGEEGEIKL